MRDQLSPEKRLCGMSYAAERRPAMTLDMHLPEEKVSSFVNSGASRKREKAGFMGLARA